MASSTRWTRVWASSRSWWRTGKPGVLQSMGLQSQTRLSNWIELTDRILFSFLSHPFPFIIWDKLCSIKLYQAIRTPESILLNCVRVLLLIHYKKLEKLLKLIGHKIIHLRNMSFIYTSTYSSKINLLVYLRNVYRNA